MPSEKIALVAAKPALIDTRCGFFVFIENKKLTGSWNYLFPGIYFILADEHSIVATILALDLTPVLIELLFLAGHYGDRSDNLHRLQVAADRPESRQAYPFMDWDILPVSGCSNDLCGGDDEPAF